MDEELKNLGGLLKRIGNYDMSSLEGRLILQKTIYLLQVFGLNLGYNFSWYIRGPYSTELTKDGFNLIEIYDGLCQRRFVAENAERRFKEYLEFLGERKNDSDWLELLASVHFLKKSYPSKDEEEIIGTLMRYKPHFTKERCREAWNHLKKYKLI